MSNLITLMLNHAKVQGLKPSTQKSYSESVNRIQKYYSKEANLITEQELKGYVFSLLNHDKLAPATIKNYLDGVKYLFRNVLNRNSVFLNKIKVPVTNKIPTVLSGFEVERILSCITTYHNRVYYTVVYSCGLRISEALNLEVQDIDGKAMRIKIRNGKGGKDRFVPLPYDTYQLLREYWATHRNPKLIFPALGYSHKLGSTSEEPMKVHTVRDALSRALKLANVNKTGISTHTFRHSYATHILEDGVDIGKLRDYLGHSSVKTTAIYLHTTAEGDADAMQKINNVVGRLRSLKR